MSGISNKLGWSIAIAVSLAFAATLATWVNAGGPLDPPGIPGVTMKSLSEVEPRTPISALPFTISQPGSYYLTSNLSVSTEIDGITVQADDVTIDLNGFELNGNTVGSGAFTEGAASPTRHNWRIYNGAIVGWAYALYAPSVLNGVLDHVNASGIHTEGLAFGAGARFSDCSIESDGIGDRFGPIGTGIAGGSGSIIESCISRAFDTGIVVDTGSIVRGCDVTVAGDGVRVGGSTVERCRIAASNGILAVSGRNSLIENQISGAGCGIRDFSGSGSTIEGNHIANSTVGVCLTANLGASATHNSFYAIAFAVFSGYTGNDVPSVVTASSATNPLANICSAPPGVCSSTP